MRYGNIIYDKRNGRVNLGDDMQLISIAHLYEHMGVPAREVVRVRYSELASYDGEPVVVPIAFPLIAYTHETFATVFSSSIVPVFLSLSLLTDVLDAREVAYLKRFAPVGCRDLHTLSTMRVHGIPAYLNGCMTLTLPHRPEAGSGSRVYLVDVPEDLRGLVPAELREGAVSVSPIRLLSELDEAPEEAARHLYEEYITQARLVITTRLHVALPCAAAGIPVVFFKREYSFRFAGVDTVVPVYSAASFDAIDWNPAPLDFEAHKHEVLALSEDRVRAAFAGYPCEVGERAAALTARLEAGPRPAPFVEGVDNARAYVRRAWEPGRRGSYALWGVTQAATALMGFIGRAYPGMRLTAVIDRNKRVKLGGVVSCPADETALEPATALFICAAAATADAERYAAECGIKEVFNCYGMDNALVYGR